MSNLGKAQTDLFSSLVEEPKLHPGFRALRDSSYHRNARFYINTLYSRMGKPSKTFMRHFQGSGFHSHLFEIACFAYLESSGLNPNRTHQSPDFLASRNGLSLAFEATTANPETQISDISLLQMKEFSQEEIELKANVEFPRRIASILNKKLKLNYEQLPHCEGKPLILMVAPFFESGSVFYTDESLLNCLYENNRDRRGFFFRKETEAISAIMYCNAFTVPRFFRLSTIFDESADIFAIREGWYYAPQPDGGLEIRSYEFPVGASSSPEESWAEGVTVFHNPNANIPISTTLLPCSSHFSFQDDGLTREVYGFHPLTSFMRMYPK